MAREENERGSEFCNSVLQNPLEPALAQRANDGVRALKTPTAELGTTPRLDPRTATVRSLAECAVNAFAIGDCQAALVALDAARELHDDQVNVERC